MGGSVASRVAVGHRRHCAGTRICLPGIFIRMSFLLQVQNPTASVINAGALCAPSAESRTPPADCERETFRTARFGEYYRFAHPGGPARGFTVRCSRDSK